MCFLAIFSIVLLEFVTFAVNTRGYLVKTVALILLLWGGHWLFGAWTSGQYHMAHAGRYYAVFALVFSVIYVLACVESTNRPKCYHH